MDFADLLKMTFRDFEVLQINIFLGIQIILSALVLL
jgi:hypothetical protein